MTGDFDLPARGHDKFSDAIRDAIGATDDEQVHVSTPQFERTKDMVDPVEAKYSNDWWAHLQILPAKTLKAMGCHEWDEPTDGKVLMLFPGEWYDKIPEGFPIVDICEMHKEFHRGKTDDDIRFGCLAYGIMARVGE